MDNVEGLRGSKDNLTPPPPTEQDNKGIDVVDVEVEDDDDDFRFLVPVATLFCDIVDVAFDHGNVISFEFSTF
jgi:hypothetical protein